MKPSLILTLLTLLFHLSSAQHKTDTLEIIEQKIWEIDRKANASTSLLTNGTFPDSAFLHQPAQGFGKLTASFNDGQLCKIREMIGIKLIHQLAYTDYYFDGGKLIYVYEEELQGPDIFIDTAGTEVRKIVMPEFYARYYFNKDKMISRLENGKRKTLLLPDEKFFDSQSKEGQLLYSAAKYYKMFMPANDSENSGSVEPIKVQEAEKIKLHLLQKLSIAGDFDGDDQLEILFQHNYSLRNKKEIIHAADPFANDWDTLVQWFDRQQPDIFLALNKKDSDTLHLGSGQGLYCLINIGDNNKDGKEEVALVFDYLDFSRVNSCKIFSLCNNKWKLLKEFSIHEGAFDFESNSTNLPPEFSRINEFLEKQKGQWLYKDYLDDFSDKQKDVGTMKKLNLEKCK